MNGDGHFNIVKKDSSELHRKCHWRLRVLNNRSVISPRPSCVAWSKSSLNGEWYETEEWFYFDRIVGGNRDYRDFDFSVVARDYFSAKRGAISPMLK